MVYGLSCTAINLENLEELHITNVLIRVRGNISHASELLGISRPGLYSKMRRYQINAKEFKQKAVSHG